MNWDWDILFLGSLMLMVTLMALSLIGLAAYINTNDNVTILALVNKGHSPIEANCAVKGTGQAVCASIVKR